MRLDIGTYQRVLGDELRRLRMMRRWSRRDLIRRLQGEISVPTLATYEYGTRQCSVVRLVEICLALGEVPHEVLTRVHQRVFGDAQAGWIRIDLRSIVRNTQPELGPLRRWAASKLDEGKLDERISHLCPDVTLDISALERLAELCGMETTDLIARLAQFSAPIREPSE